MFPLYIWLVTGLLLLALTFFVFAQAAVVRSGAQSAADAAALAAASPRRAILPATGMARQGYGRTPSSRACATAA